MAFAFYYPTKGNPSASWIPENGPAFPLSTPEDYPGQIILRSGDNSIHVQEQGSLRRSVSLRFVNISSADESSYRNFFEAVKKSFHSFQFEDLDGSLHAAKIMNGFNFQKTGVLSFSGSIQLEIE